MKKDSILLIMGVVFLLTWVGFWQYSSQEKFAQADELRPTLAVFAGVLFFLAFPLTFFLFAQLRETLREQKKASVKKQDCDEGNI